MVLMIVLLVDIVAEKIIVGCTVELAKKKTFHNLVKDGQQEDDDGCPIDCMHYPKVKAVRPIGVFLPEKIHHGTKLKKAIPKATVSGWRIFSFLKGMIT